MTDPDQRPPSTAAEHRRFWLTYGLAGILVALIGLVGTIIAARGGDQPSPPAAASSRPPAARSSPPATEDRPPPAQEQDGYAVRYENVRFSLPHPGSTCLDNIVMFEADRPQVETGQISAVGEVTSYDLVYSNCGSSNGEMWLTVPEGGHDFALVDGKPEAAQCAEAANLRQGAPRRMLAQSVRAGRTYCMTTSNDALVRFTIVSVTPRYDLAIEATAWVRW